MKRFIAALLLVGGLGMGSALAQNYNVWSSSQPYVPLTGGTPITLSSIDDGYALVTLPFAFPYYGNSYTSVYVNGNGRLSFGASATSLTPRVIPSSTSTPPHNFIAMWWMDLYGTSPGVIRTVQTPFDVTIEWADWSYYTVGTINGNGTFSFWVKLSSTGMIQIHYGAHTGTGPSATFGAAAGFEDSTGLQGAALLTCSPACLLAGWPANTLYTIGQPVEADLTVSQVDRSNMVRDAGTLSFDISATFHNFGQTDAGDFFWNAYLSTDRILQADGGSTDGGYPDTLVHSSTSPLLCQGVSSVTDTASVVVAPEPP
ncbi:MAG: hypothetical protein ACYC8T_32150, partial [Myxococcaceae bacterium]